MANPKLGAKSVPGVACYPLVTHKKISNKFWGSHNWCPWTHILDSHIGQSYWTVIMTVLFFIVPVQYDCPVCEMCLNKPSSSHKNVRPLFIVKIWILGYNDHDQHLTTQTDALSTHAATHLFTQLFESAAEDVEFGERGHRRFHPGQVEQHRLAVMGPGQSGEMSL